MSERVIVACPDCHKRYRVRAETIGQQARCSNCHTIFDLLSPDQGQLDQQVLQWLDENPDQAESATPADEKRQSAKQLIPPEGTVAGLKVIPDSKVPAGKSDDDTHTAASAQAAKPARPARPETDQSKKFALHRIDAMGAYCRFPAQNLHDPAFRGSFPQVCAHCLSTKHLSVHLVQWTSKLPNRGLLAGKEISSRPMMKLADLPTTNPLEVLNFLPRIESLPLPFNLPFPYYVCSDCSPIGLLHANTSFAKEGEKCWLSISNLEVARRLYAAVRGTDDSDYAKLVKAVQVAKQDRWKSFPLAVRNRIKQWYKSEKGEQFLDYLPDKDFIKAEVGNSGLVITNQRLIYKKYHVLRQFPLSDPISITISQTSEGLRVEISSAAHGRAVAKLNDKSWTTLHEQLEQLKAQLEILEG